MFSVYCCRKGIARLFDICSYRQTLVSRQICHESRIMLLYFLFRACIIARYNPENLSRTISFKRYFCATLVSSRFSLSLYFHSTLESPALYADIWDSSSRRIAILREFRNDNPACTHMPSEPATTICRADVFS